MVDSEIDRQLVPSRATRIDLAHFLVPQQGEASVSFTWRDEPPPPPTAYLDTWDMAFRGIKKKKSQEKANVTDVVGKVCRDINGVRLLSSPPASPYNTRFDTLILLNLFVQGFGKALTELERVHMRQEEAKSKARLLVHALSPVVIYRSNCKKHVLFQKWLARYLRAKKLNKRVTERRQSKKGSQLRSTSESRSRSPTRSKDRDKLRTSLRNLNGALEQLSAGQ